VPRLDPESLPGHVDRLYRAAWALCGSPHDAEDLVQETFARVLSRPRVLRGDDELAYLMRVLRNTFLSSRRTASRRPQVSARIEELEIADRSGADLPEAALDAQAIYGAIADLPDDFRLALVAVDIVGLSYGEAGRVLGAPEATITSRLHRARRRVVAAVDAVSAADADARPQEGSSRRRSLD
jgi:RNA polymerase sigma-70 factor (ECF subfamily)